MTGVPDVTIVLLESHRHNQGQPVLTTKTGKDGHFKLKYSKIKIYEYSIRFDFKGGSSSEISTPDKTSLINFELPSNTIVKFKVKNNLSDFADLYINNDSYSVARIAANSETTLNRTYSIKSFGTTTFNWYYKKYGSADTSIHQTEFVTLNSLTDTLYRAIEIN